MDSVIFDEVVTGWGRTGSAFASQEFGVTPDIITMAKATTNGIVPMGVVAVREKIYNEIMEATPDGGIELFMVIHIQDTCRRLSSVSSTRNF